MDYMNDCVDLVHDVWNRWRGARVEYISGTGPMRDRKGGILPQSLIQNDVEYHQFQVGAKPPIWCVWDGEQLTLSDYPASYMPPVPPTVE